MNPRTFFDFNRYVSGLVRSNRLARREGFRFATCSGIGQLQGVMDGLRTAGRFVVADDVCTGETRQQGGAFFQRRTFTLFILSRCRLGDEPDRARQLGLCRELRRQLQSRLLRDSQRLQDELVYLQTSEMPGTELGEHFAGGCTGLYMMVSVDEPVDVSYNVEEWDDE